MVQVLAGVVDPHLASQIQKAGAAAGAQVKVVNTSTDLLFRTQQMQPAIVLVDLEAAPLSPVETISAIRRTDPAGDIRIIGFLSQERGDIRQRALDAGAIEIISRDSLPEHLPALLK